MSGVIKIAGVAGSPHMAGMTAELLEQALAGARSAGAQTKLISLVDEQMEPCMGCDGSCWETRECVLDPASAPRHAALQDADGLIMAVPVYCWQMNSLTHLFIDKMRWDTGSVLEHRNTRAAFGIACAGGSGTGCVLALQALYRYFYNWSFHGVEPLPVTRFNFSDALSVAYDGGTALVNTIQCGVKPFQSLGAAMADLESLAYMAYGPVDELWLIVRQLRAGIDAASGPYAQAFHTYAAQAESAFTTGNRGLAADLLSKAYETGIGVWKPC